MALAFSFPPQQDAGFEWHKKSMLSATSRVEFPGIVLEPGNYVVRLRESGERRSVVEITNKDETQVFATFVAVPDHRMRPDDNSEFTFHAVEGDGARPVQTWFFAGDLIGLEFVYPKPRAKEIATQTGERVMAFNRIKDGVIVAVTSSGNEVVIDDPATHAARAKPE